MSRARVLSAACAAFIALLFTTPAADAAARSCPPDQPCLPALPTVDMGRVVLAATLDPSRVDDTRTAGAGRSVELVEQALRARGLLGKKAVDGYFGSDTIAAWGRFEAQQGETSVWARNGLPGLDELRALGTGRFTLGNAFDVGGRVTLKSVASGGNSNDGADVVNVRTQRMFLEAQRNLARTNSRGRDMTVVQGGYCGAGCAAASAGTHSGGGAIDIRTYDTDARGIDNRIVALRQVGFAAWYRPFTDNTHIHATAINDYQMTWEMHGKGAAPAPVLGSYGGNCQVYEWKFNFDGLEGCNDSAPSGTPGQKALQTWEGYLAKRG